MVTVAHIVAGIIQKRPFLEEALVNDIINYAYLADMLKPEVEKLMRKEVNRYAIIMAIRRFSESLKESFIGSPILGITGADITITSGIFEVTVVKSANTLKELSKLYDIVNFSSGDFLTVTQGLFEITIISNMKYMDEMLCLFDKKDIKKKSTDLSSVIVRIPEKTAESMGVLYLLTKALSWDNVNIFEVVSTLTEEIFIIPENDTTTAFDAIKGLMGKNKSAKK